MFRGLLQAMRIGVASAFLEIASNRFRSALTLLGVALCIGAVTAMLTLIQGMNLYMKNMVQQMGGVNRVGFMHQQPEGLTQEMRFSRSPGLRLSDADSLSMRADIGAEPIRKIESNLQVRFRTTQSRIQVTGVDRITLEQKEEVFPRDGRFFQSGEYDGAMRVCILGWRAEERFLSRDNGLRGRGKPSLVDSTVFINGQVYRVVGVYSQENTRQRWAGRGIYIPLESMRRDFSGINPGIGSMIVDLDDPDMLEEGVESVLGLLRSLHRGADDMRVQLFDWVDEFRTMMVNFRLFMAAVGILSLTVGAANIVNVMLSAIYARISEIGVRKSLGATGFQIFLQFLFESVTLSLIGGALGCVLGSIPIFFADTIEDAMQIRPLLDMVAIGWVAVISVGLGIFSGLYPAIKAARMDPIEALRYE